MTWDDIMKAIIASVLALIVGAISWLVSSVLSVRERFLEVKGRLDKAEADVASLSSRQITVENVRDVIEEALTKRDKEYEKRRAEWDKLRQLEVREAVRDELEKNIPRLVREIKGAQE